MITESSIVLASILVIGLLGLIAFFLYAIIITLLRIEEGNSNV